MLDRRLLSGVALGAASDSLLGAASIAALAAALFSIWIYGLAVLSPSAYAWMLHGDPAQHLLGATRFLSQPWQWPPGAIAVSEGAQSSAAFVDAIPLVALIAKAVSWPAHWQYFGIWLLLSHVCMAVCAAMLLKKFGLTTWATLVGAVFFVISPTVMLRAYGHEALMAQWIIVWAFLLGIHSWRLTHWLALVVVSLLIHPYIGAMGLAFALSVCLLRSGAWIKPMHQFFSVAAILVAGLTVMWLAGYFVGSGELSATGFGFFSANLLTWIDPMDWMDFLRFHGRSTDSAAQWSQFFGSPGQATRGQYEGFAYLGAGMIGLCITGLALAAIPARKRTPATTAPLNKHIFLSLWPLGIAALAMAIFAVSSTVTLGPYVLLELPLPQWATQLAGVFRASGRFVWPLTFLVMLVAIVSVGRRHWGVGLLSVALAIQLIDLGPKLMELRQRFHEAKGWAAQQASSAAWGQLFARCPNLTVIGETAHQGAWAAPAMVAITHGAGVDPISVARPSQTQLLEREANILVTIQTNNWAPRTVYLLVPGQGQLGEAINKLARNDQAAPPGMRFSQIDGYAVLYSAFCE